MRFTILTLIAFAAAFAVSFALITNPNSFALEVLHLTHVLSACVGLVIAFHTTGKTQSYSLTYAIFSFATISYRPFPTSVTNWIWENVTHNGPDSLPAGNGDSFLVIDLIQVCFSILVSLFAASLVAGMQREKPKNVA
ncbi:hypothetical protein [Novipirellula rosea]|uniref:Uncharacterized protein n=1 Tax=Novipirellula rosea TaxID=1031540 RepID=A0ABP8NLA0_9BACT